jgi:hypothetical protein
MQDEFVESIAEIFPDSDLAYEAAIANGNPTTEGFYPEWDGDDDSWCGNPDCETCV